MREALAATFCTLQFILASGDTATFSTSQTKFASVLAAEVASIRVLSQFETIDRSTATEFWSK